MKPVIVCVDDERFVLDSLKEQLNRHFEGQYEIEITESGEDAMEVLEELHEDRQVVPVVVSDHIMPGMKGDELLAHVRARWPRTRNVLLTGQASADAIGRAVNNGNLFRYIGKPWDQRDLCLTLTQAIESFFAELDLAAERETLERINLVALDLSAALAADSRYRRLLAAARSALDAEGAALCSVWGDALKYVAADGVDQADVGTPVEGDRRALLMSALGTCAPARSRDAIAVALRFEDVVAGGLLVRVRDPSRIPDSRVMAFAALGAAAFRTAALVDALEDDAERTRQLAQALQREANANVDGPLLGKGDRVVRLRREIDEAAQHDDDVLLVGHPGSGREAVARAIHRVSGRRDNAFIMINGPMQSAAGNSAFAPVAGSRTSTMELADGGTLYLHDPDALDGAERTRLSEYVRTREDARARGDRVVVDVRIIATRNDQSFPPPLPIPWEPAAQSIEVPALHERKVDIEPLASHILTSHARRHGRPIDGLTPAAVRRLGEYAWPGNYSELVNVVQHSVDIARGTLIDAQDILLSGGTHFGQYHLERRLGEGAMGEVWIAVHGLLSRQAAIKLIQPHFASAGMKDLALKRFRTEAQATAKLRSPHTVELYDFGVTDDGTMFYVMELLDGLDLNAMVRTFGPLRPERAVWFLKQTCRSLIEAHTAGLVHRDIKPANIFAARLGAEYDFTKVLDFGLVTGAGGEVRPTTPGKATTTAGTPGFMAPEQCAGESQARSDIYALGCVAFWLLTRRFVFNADNLVGMMVQHAMAPPPVPSSVSPFALPKALDDAVLHCLEKKPEDRPSADMLYKQLAAIDFDEPWSPERAEQWWRDRDL